MVRSLRARWLPDGSSLRPESLSVSIDRSNRLASSYPPPGLAVKKPTRRSGYAATIAAAYSAAPGVVGLVRQKGDAEHERLVDPEPVHVGDQALDGNAEVLLPPGLAGVPAGA